ncbi:hypothetical protein EYF80_059838 [Liparis tanakae]|uniref:Uncharacterized protein n=1 Tax=Liparis tanakae TaxID=230148 RepID=A0A4Z2ENP8_9TELE|nr:hypothetical protein EYF80_059838 [Liparis tanakae]
MNQKRAMCAGLPDHEASTNNTMRGASVAKAPHGHDGGRGLCTASAHGGVQERGRGVGAVEDELGRAQTGRWRRRLRDLRRGGGGGRSQLLRLALIGLGENLHERKV